MTKTSDNHPHKWSGENQALKPFKTKSVHRAILLGVQHPHMWTRIALLKNCFPTLQLVGFFDEDEVTAEKFAQSEPEIKRFLDKDSITSIDYDLCFIHALDHDVPRYARMSCKDSLKGLFLEKPGAALPKDLLDLETFIQSNYPKIVVEFGWEMHYSDTMDYIREIKSSGCLGVITSAHFHGGTPSGASFEKWQRLDSTLGGFIYTDGSHTIEQVVDLYGLPNRVCASIRPLPGSKEAFKTVVMYDDLFGEPKLDKVVMKVGTLATEQGKTREDIGSVILEYPTLNVSVDFTAWEANQWCEDWTIDIYGTNGTVHAFLDPSSATLYLREARAGYNAGYSNFSAQDGNKKSRAIEYFYRQLTCFCERVENSDSDSKILSCDWPNEIVLMKVLQAMYDSAAKGSFVKV